MEGVPLEPPHISGLGCNADMSVVSCAVRIMKPALNLPDSVHVPPTLLILRSKEAQSIRRVAHGAHPAKTEEHSTFLQVKLAVFTPQHHTSREKTTAISRELGRWESACLAGASLGSPCSHPKQGPPGTAEINTLEA